MDTDPHRPSQPVDIALQLLVIRCQAGDEQAFARLLDRFGPKTLRYLRHIVGDDADDVQQEVWLDVYRRVSQLATPRSFVSWLFTITRHRAVDYLRRRRRARELLEDVAAESLVYDEAVDQPDAPDLPELSTALANLQPLHREVLLLRYQDDLSYEEIAAVVGCSVGTVKSRLHHAKRRLHSQYANSRGDER
jgi:RNA polymerase sigma-70 factor (ECF subfamily)